MMKILPYFVCVILIVNGAVAQTTNKSIQSSIPIEMLFPEGKSKALILSYDDGRIQDRQLVELMNKYKLKGTFHLNANKLGEKDYLSKSEIKNLFIGHEVSAHSFNHPNLTTITKVDVVYEVLEDRKELERLMNYPIRGMAYPFGNNNDEVVKTINGLGIEYARTVDDTYHFSIPENFLKWHPTIHQFAKAYWNPNQPETDAKELAIFYKTINNFLESKELAVLDVWGHSWEMGADEKKWDETEKFFKMLANNSNVYYTTQIDLVDYINAFKSLKFSVDKKSVFNPSAATVNFKYIGAIYKIGAGETTSL